MFTLFIKSAVIFCYLIYIYIFNFQINVFISLITNKLLLNNLLYNLFESLHVKLRKDTKEYLSIFGK